MTVYVDPVDASHVLAKAAADVVYAPNAGDIGDALGRLDDALQHYELCCLVSPVPKYRPATWRDATFRFENSTVPSDDRQRFRAALATVDWRARSPVGLADLMIAISLEVADCHEIPNDDPAVRLIVGKMAEACGIAVDSDQVADLIRECFNRSKERSSRQRRTA